MAGPRYSFAVLGMVSVLLLVAVLPGCASPVSDKQGSTAAWNHTPTDWPTFRGNVARTGVSPANATMKFAYLKWSYKTGGSRISSSPAVADVDNDKWPEVLIGSEDNRLYCLNASSGKIKWRFQTQGPIFSSPAIGDINNDGYAEVVFGSNDGRLHVLNGTSGYRIWSYAGRGGFYASPAIADLNSDGKPEIVASAFDGWIYAFYGNGTRLWTLRVDIGSQDDGIMSSPAVGDIWHDGTLEVVQLAGNCMYVMNGTTGQVRWTFTFQDNKNRFYATPVLKDLNGNGTLEMIIIRAVQPALFVISVDDDRFASLWLTTWVRVVSSPSVADGDDDSYHEVYFGTDAGEMECYQLRETNWSWAVAQDWHRNVSSPVRSSPALADIDGDGRLEVLFGTDNRRLMALNAEDGTLTWMYIFPKGIFSSPAVADGDLDGKAEVYFGCYDGGVYALDYNF